MTAAAPSSIKNQTQYEAVIGLETHCQLSTKTKIFSSSSTEFGNTPNTNIDPICMGMPGVLPGVGSQLRNRTLQQVRSQTIFLSRFTEKLSNFSVRFADRH